MKHHQKSLFPLIIIGIGLPAGEATMPFGDTLPLSESQPELAAKILTWIDEGALDN